MTFSQNFYLFKGSWEISLLFLIVLVVLPYGGLLQQHLQGEVKQILLGCIQWSRIKHYGHWERIYYVNSWCGIPQLDALYLHDTSSWRHLKKPWVIHLLCNYLKAYEAMIWVWSAKPTLRCLGAKFLEIFLDCFVCRGKRHGFWSSALVMLDFCTVTLNPDILI